MLPKSDSVKLEIFALDGTKVDKLFDGLMNAGNHLVTWDPKNLPSGVYYYTITTPDTIMTRKMVLLK